MAIFIHKEIKDQLNNDAFILAMLIISENINVNITINQVKDHISTGKILVIHEAPASVIKKLVENGFSLYPSKDGIHVTKL